MASNTYNREYYLQNRERIRARERGYGDTRQRGDRSEYMRQWWAQLSPERRACIARRSNRTRAVKGLPPEIHNMRLVLMEFRSRVAMESGK